LNFRTLASASAGRFKLTRQRLHIRLGFLVEIGRRQLGPERAERFGATPCDRVIVGDANDEAFLVLSVHPDDAPSARNMWWAESMALREELDQAATA